ncbi:hypothetical protein F8388_007576 [Cannabis sativa]|uniref:Uncharacterized protein n=1 Tax=Cannabis sativa TaxID=3483 RepID=A0A7J6ERZ7_CANSA|nr:hypothetical protein G4B88_027711 [Cannabis sativa]KAF4361560.1 hypothetical protein F8388_007576 [Cannabis sativa]
MAYRGAPLGPPPMAAVASSSASTVRRELRDWRVKLRQRSDGADCIWKGEASISPICGGAVAFCAPAGEADAAQKICAVATAAESKKEEKVEEIEESDEIYNHV